MRVHTCSKWQNLYMVHDEDHRTHGRHTQAVQDIIDEVCVYDGCRYWCNTLNPASMLEFVTPAFTVGIQQHLEVIRANTCFQHADRTVAL